MSDLSNPRRAFRVGLIDSLPFLLIIVPFGTLFGVVATEAGLKVTETMAMSFLIVAGAAQFTAIGLMQEQAPTLIVIVTAMMVNMRMAMYSAALVPHLGKAPVWQRGLVAYFMVDQAFGLAIQKYEEQPHMPVQAKFMYFFGAFIIVGLFWYACTYIGAVLGEQIPPEYALDFAVPICFIALFAPALRSLPHVMAALVSIIIALLAVNMPYSLGLMVAALAGIIAGAETERQLTLRAARNAR